MTSACRKTGPRTYEASFRVTVTGGNNWDFLHAESVSGDSAIYTEKVTTIEPAPGTLTLHFTAFQVTSRHGSRSDIHTLTLPDRLRRRSRCS